MAMAGISANRLELLQIADAVAREKSIDRKIVIEAMEDAIQKAAKSRYGAENDIRCEIDPKTGEARLTRVLAVVENVENDVHADHARRCAGTQRRGQDRRPDRRSRCRPSISVASPHRTPSRSSCRRCARPSASASYGEYKDRIGEIVNGTVKRVEYGNVIVDLGRAEGIIRRDEMIPRENVRYGDRVRAYIYDVRREQRGPQIFLSRARPEFMSKLFAQEVPEIYDGVVEIKSVARDPGSRAKIAVISKDSSIDPVGACVGMRGSARAGRRQRAAGREGRHHPVEPGRGELHRQRAGARRGDEGRARRGHQPHRGRRSRKPAFARHRPARPERAPRLAAHRLGYRYPDRARGDASGARRSSPSARNMLMEHSTSTRSSPSCSSPRASPRSRRLPSSSSPKSRTSKASTRTRPMRSSRARAITSRSRKPTATPNGASSASPTIWPRSRA